MTRFLFLVIVLVWGCAAQVLGQVQFETVTKEFPVDIKKYSVTKAFKNLEHEGDEVFWMLQQGYGEKSSKNILLRFNLKKNNFDAPLECKMKINGEEVGFTDALCLGGQLTMIGKKFDSQKGSLGWYGQKFNTTGIGIGQPKLLMTEGTNRLAAKNHTFRYKEGFNQKYFVQYDFFYEEKGNYLKLYFDVFDQDLNLKWKRTVELPASAEAEDFLLLEDGTIVIAVLNPTKGKTAYSFYFVTDDKSQIHQASLPWENKLPAMMKLNVDPNTGDVLAAGCYFEKSTTTADGYLACRISKVTKEVVNHVATTFSAEIKNRMAQLHQTQDKVQGKKGEIYFRVKEIHTNSNLDLFVNGYFTYIYTIIDSWGTGLNYNCFDLITLKLNSELKYENYNLTKTSMRDQFQNYNIRYFKASLNSEYITNLIDNDIYIIYPENMSIFKGNDTEKLNINHVSGSNKISVLVKIDKSGKATQKMKLEERGHRMPNLKDGILINDMFIILNSSGGYPNRIDKLILK